MIRCFFILVVFLVQMVASLVAFPQVPNDSSIIKLKAEISKFSIDPTMKKAKWGICVVTADSQKTVIAYNDTIGLIPASTMKAINTAASLSMLGKDYTFKTYLFYDGDIDKDSVLHGNIYIRGGGDPSLGSPRIDSLNDIKYLLPLWVKNIQKQGIKKIDGAIIGDASIFDDTIAPSTWDKDDLGTYYGAGASGLTFHENTFRIILKPGKKYKDSARVVELDPPIPYITIENKVWTGGPYTPEDLWVGGVPYSNKRIIKGVVPRDTFKFPIRASLPDPAFYCAYSLFKALKDSGVVVKDSCTTLKQAKEKGKLKTRAFTFFYNQVSPPLDTLAFYTNRFSINTWAENILKILAYEKTGTGSTIEGTRLVTQFWKSKGVDLKGFEMKDGSGLSPEDRVSPRHLAEIMRAEISDTLFPVFYHTLPIAGKSGSISNIFKGTVAENNLRAKSGYMRGIRSYTGYVYNKKNKLLTFGIIVNNHTASAAKMQKMLEKIMILIAETEW
jgi:serine-type D-Ala-D-Ala carboxypeptidase/endopeptidase (penicillin-binding protein 4)